MTDFDTICNEVQKKKRTYRPMSPEIVLTSSFYFDDFNEYAEATSNEFEHYVYTRGTNPTTELLEEKLAKMEEGERCKVFASGMGAISATFFTMLKANDHVIFVNTVYGTTVSLIRYMERYQISYDIVNSTDTDVILSYIKDETHIIYMESPSSQKFELIDLEAIAKVAKQKDIITVIDNTWATPIYQRPLVHGIDIVIHSCSKYIGGHSDIVAGAVISSKQTVELIEEKGFLYLGATCSPLNSYLALRGLRTMPVRMRQFTKNICTVLDYLSTDKRIKKIHHPYCGNAWQKQLAEKYLDGYGSLFGIDMVDDDLDKLKVFVIALQVFTLGVSWGGFECLVLPVFKGNNQQAIIDRGLDVTHLRIYVGLENPQELIEDIKAALTIAYGK